MTDYLVPLAIDKVHELVLTGVVDIGRLQPPVVLALYNYQRVKAAIVFESVWLVREYSCIGKSTVVIGAFTTEEEAKKVCMEPSARSSRSYRQLILNYQYQIEESSR